jgi:hypothetical protein
MRKMLLNQDRFSFLAVTYNPATLGQTQKNLADISQDFVGEIQGSQML